MKLENNEVEITFSIDISTRNGQGVYQQFGFSISKDIDMENLFKTIKKKLSDNDKDQWKKTIHNYIRSKIKWMP